ncbi:MAG: hypothetical protein WC389_08060 [Lutibacter sp.]|jgi:hypothetical protein
MSDKEKIKEKLLDIEKHLQIYFQTAREFAPTKDAHINQAKTFLQQLLAELDKPEPKQESGEFVKLIKERNLIFRDVSELSCVLKKACDIIEAQQKEIEKLKTAVLNAFNFTKYAGSCRMANTQEYMEAFFQKCSDLQIETEQYLKESEK